MVAKQLISKEIPTLSVSQTGKDAFHILSDYHVKHLPVTDTGRLVGIISEEDIFNHKLYEPIGEYDFSMLRRFSVVENDHVFEVMRIMGENRLTIIPVVDESENYLGLVSQNDLMRFFANTTSFSEPGAILVLEMSARDYSLAKIARLVEEEDVKILSSTVTSTLDSEFLEVTLKLNRHELGKVIASFHRHEIEVKETFDETEQTDTMQERYDSFMHFLNM
jgi:acetoin utilization protein AcuB